VISLIFVGLISVVIGSTTLIVFALGIPIFNALQYTMSCWLRRLSGYEAPRVGPSLPALGLALASAVLTIVLSPSIAWLAAVFVGVAALLLASNRTTLRLKV
jgi:hypothetical protein